MATPSRRSPFRRRSLFKAAGLGAAGAAGLPVIAACSDIESGGGGTQVTEGLDFLPTYKEWPLPVQPDLIGEPPHHPSGFTVHPEAVQAITEVPENSGTYELTVPNWGEGPSGDDPYFQAVSKAWGGTKINLRYADGNEFAETSVQWLQAKEFGDAIHMFSWMLLAHTDFQNTVPNTFYDLTDILKGDISERWPLLAGLPTSSWGNSVWATDPEDPETSRIFGIPGPASGGPGNGMFVRTDLLADAGLDKPTTIEELLEVAREWTDGSAGKWAFAGLDYYTPMWFGLPSRDNWWFDEEQDKLLHRSEMPEYKEWLEFRRTLWDEGLVHPDAPTGTLDTQALHKEGTILFQQDGMSWWGGYTDQVNSGEAEGDIEPLGPLAAEGRTPLVHVNFGVDGWTFLRKDLEKEQVEEFLDVANFCAAPLGTTEYELLIYGVEGEHFEYGDDGTPVYTETGTAVVNAPVNFKTIARVQNFLAGGADRVQRVFDYNASVLEYAEVDIFEGLRVEGPAAFKDARATLEDQENDVSYGRAELSEIDSMVEDFLAAGGEEAREHYTAAYRTAQGE
ncbi:extracellular solute-binding protein [Glycomyces buryatensis]|uniref:Extracellular solute-binding protein n=1 Tax=Glycomyces buryatensis TaxID=2570927 RepID=A0A4S8Q305_9ACTN|nr:extracellular solute-binding protein [Glycomyces buryatensis]THV38577.1 extracellular solute-binding protein [Glycomyces buryatensis]